MSYIQQDLVSKGKKKKPPPVQTKTGGISKNWEDSGVVVGEGHEGLIRTF
jgi:hypothetical protein